MRRSEAVVLDLLMLSWFLIILVLIYEEDHLVKYSLVINLLCIIIFSPYTIYIKPYFIMISFIGFLLGIIYLFSQHPFKSSDWIYLFFSILLYVGSRLFEMISPVWYVLYPNGILAIIILLVTVMITTHNRSQIAIICSILMVGELIIIFLYNEYGITNTMDDQIFYVFFNVLFIRYVFLFISRIVRTI